MGGRDDGSLEASLLQIVKLYFKKMKKRLKKKSERGYQQRKFKTPWCSAWASVTGFGLYLRLWLSTRLLPRPTHPVVSIYPLMIKGQVWKLGMQKYRETCSGATPEFVQERPRPWLQHFCRQRQDRTQGCHMKICPVLCGHVCCLDQLSASRED